MYEIKFKNTDLASRRSASVQRNEIYNAIQNADFIVLDLTNVKSISDSYADELFGVLALKEGASWIRKHIKIKGVDDYVYDTISQTIKIRARETKETSVTPVVS